MLCTLGFMDVVMFSHNGPMARHCVFLSDDRRKSTPAEIPTKFCETIKTGSSGTSEVLIASCVSGGEVYYLRLPRCNRGRNRISRGLML